MFVLFVLLYNYDGVVVPRPYTEVFKKTFLFLGPKIGNKVDSNVINLTSDSTFKIYVTSLLFSIHNIERWLSF